MLRQIIRGRGVLAEGTAITAVTGHRYNRCNCPVEALVSGGPEHCRY